MKDFHFWLGLPSILMACSPDLQTQLSSLKQQFESLEANIKEAKTTLMSFLIDKSNKSNKDERLGVLLKALEEKKSKIVAVCINTTLQGLRLLLERLEKGLFPSLKEIRLGLRVSRAIIEKALEEYGGCSNLKEKPLYLMLKVYGEKCLEKLVNRITGVLESESSLSDEGNEEEEEEEGTYGNSTANTSMID